MGHTPSFPRVRPLQPGRRRRASAGTGCRFGLLSALRARRPKGRKMPRLGGETERREATGRPARRGRAWATHQASCRFAPSNPAGRGGLPPGPAAFLDSSRPSERGGRRAGKCHGWEARQRGGRPRADRPGGGGRGSRTAPHSPVAGRVPVGGGFSVLMWEEAESVRKEPAKLSTPTRDGRSRFDSLRQLCDRPAARLLAPALRGSAGRRRSPATLFPKSARSRAFGTEKYRFGLAPPPSGREEVCRSSARTSLHGPAEVALRRRECRRPRSETEDPPPPPELSLENGARRRPVAAGSWLREDPLLPSEKQERGWPDSEPPFPKKRRKPRNFASPLAAGPLAGRPSRDLVLFALGLESPVASLSSRRGRRGDAASDPTDRYLVDPASSHMLVSKIKPCMSKYKPPHGETANGSLDQLWFLRSYNSTRITVAILELIRARKL